ncbi:MAG: T9SS type A sorting domain-containing protein [Bacteroidales bacterium]|nr:T9SS type A sorting domain-containing protein [Bacteroidales bacterium]
MGLPCYDGCWGAYPFLPSGNILASDMQEGLYILEPDYQRACYVEGTVTDSITGLPLSNVLVRIISADASTKTGLDGTYAFGTPLSGTYDIEFLHSDYPTLTLTDIELVNGQLTLLDVVMSSWFVGISDQLAGSEAKAYPNPFGTEMKVEFVLNKARSPDASLRVFDITGRLVETIVLQSATGSVQIGMDYPAGTYFVKISNGNEELKMLRVTKN